MHLKVIRDTGRFVTGRSSGNWVHSVSFHAAEATKVTLLYMYVASKIKAGDKHEKNKLHAGEWRWPLTCTWRRS
jgi:hypothetical protein